jgi:hypothetical protein
MKTYPVQFSRLPYYEHLEIVQLFDTMHIKKNVIETLWGVIDRRSEFFFFFQDTNDIKEANHAMKSVIHSNSDAYGQNISALPWLLTEKQSKDVKEVIEKIKLPIGFSSNTKNNLTKKGELSGVKTLDIT